MKNEEISLQTKKMLAESLKKAMRKKSFSKITVSEIIEDCHVNRKTFYYHFTDIYALLKWMFEEEAIQVVRNFDLLVDYEAAISFVMDYVEENDYVISCAYDSVGQEEMKRFFYADFIDIISSVFDNIDNTMQGKHIDADYKSFLICFFTEALAGMLMKYVRDQTIRNRHQTTLYLCKILNGIKKYLIEDSQSICEYDIPKEPELRKE